MKIPNDLKRFRSLTKNKIVVMGRNTYESLPNDLEERWNVVITSDLYYKGRSNKVEVCYCLEDTFEFLDQCVSSYGYSPDDIFIIGGGKVYEQFAPYCDKAYITKIYKTFEADTYMLNLDNETKWKVTGMYPMDIYHEISYKFIEYENMQPLTGITY